MKKTNPIIIYKSATVGNSELQVSNLMLKKVKETKSHVSTGPNVCIRVGVAQTIASSFRCKNLKKIVQ